MIMLIELDIKDTTVTAVSTSYLDIHLEIDSECRIRTNHNDKRDDFIFFQSELSIFMSQHYSNTCIWSIFLSFDMIFNSL
jgi:hypothetical protein